MLDTTDVLTVKAKELLEPVQKGHEVLNLTCVAFLLEHEPSSRKVMFDLGIRKDYWNLPSVVQKRLCTLPGLKVDKDTTEILMDNQISLNSICKY